MTITLAASVFAAVDGGWLAWWAGLAPWRIWHGEVWRLVTWVFVEHGPLALIMTCMSLHKFGGELVTVWGERRLRRFSIEVLGGAAVVTALLGLVSRDSWYLHRLGGWAVGDMLVIAWARQFPDRELIVAGLLRLRGKDLIGVIVGMVALFAIFNGPFAMAPEILAVAGAYWYPGTRLARR
jgi:membrane associated rhomboid family serine protease